MYRNLLILLVVIGVLTLAVKLLRTNWRAAGRQARDVGADLASKGRAAGEQLGDRGRAIGGTLAERGKAAAADLGERAGEVGARAGERAEVLRDRTADVAGSFAARHDGRLAARLERTLVVAAPVETVAALVAAGMAQAPLFDEVPPEPGERAAWVYEALGVVRLALAADPRPGDPDSTGAPGAPRCIVGVVRYEVVMGEPQGGPATEHALDQVLGVLATHEVTVEQIQRPFAGPAPDADHGTSDGTRTAGPLP